MYTFNDTALDQRLRDCLTEYEAYRQALNIICDFTSPVAIIDKLSKVTSHNASVPHLMARFEYLHQKATAAEMTKLDHDSYPARKYDALIKSAVADIGIFTTGLELLIKESHYQIEAMRSVLSYLKQEITN